MRAAYNGALFQIQRASDSTTANIGTVSSGVVDLATAKSFCTNTTCVYTELFDQSGNGNTLIYNNNACGTCPLVNPVRYNKQFINPNQLPVYYTNEGGDGGALGTAPGVFKHDTVGQPSGNQSFMLYWVHDNMQFSICCGSWGLSETTFHDDGDGTIWYLAYCGGDAIFCPITPARIGLDLENGAARSVFAVPFSTQRFALITKHINAGLQSVIKFANAESSGGMTTVYNGNDFVTMNVETGINLGIGGDGVATQTAFYEGVITSSATSDALDVLLQNDIAAFYHNDGGLCAGCIIYPKNQNYNTTLGVGANSATLLGTHAGRFIVVGITYCQDASCATNPGYTISSVTSSNSGSGETCIQVPGAAQVSHLSTDIWYCPNIVGGNDTITATPSNGSAQYVSVALSEWAGINPSTPVDAGLANNVHGDFNSTGTSVSTNGSVTAANELVYSIIGVGGGNVVSSTQTAANMNAANTIVADEYQLSSAPGVVTNSATWPGPGVNFGGSIAVFKHN